MSFTADVKTELAKRRPGSEACRLAQLAGLTRACGSLRLSREGRSILYRTESAAAAKCVVILAESLYDLDTSMELTRQEHRKAPLTQVILSGKDADALLYDTGTLPDLMSPTPAQNRLARALSENSGCRTALLRGAFLGSGSVTDPNRGYHLEIVTRTEAFSDLILSSMHDAGISGRRSIRKEREIVYVRGDDVASLLILLGANSAVIRFENTRTEKDYRNYMNRTSNCDTANIGKTVNASVDQRNAILRIEERIGIRSLSSPLLEAALLRLNNPDATLAELAELAGIGKSGMNHRLNRLIALAEELKE